MNELNFSTNDVNFFDEDGQSAKFEFQHSDETRPFLVCEEVDSMRFVDDGHCIEVYNRDYKYPIFTVHEWEFWRQVYQKRT